MEIGRLFWEQLDPLYHLLQATCFRYTKDLTQHYRLDEQHLAETPLGAELQSGFEDMQQSAMRFTRFHATETFLTVLLGSGPHGPVPRFSSKVRFDAFNSAVAQLGDQKIPDILPIAGIADFGPWLSTMFWGKRNMDPLEEEIVEFIALQARFFGLKSAYNAFKHGCRVGHSAPKFSVQDEKTGEWIEIIKMDSALAWIEWSEKKSKPISVEYGVVECDAADDHGAILVMALLVRAMKAFRLRKPGEDIKVDMPNNLTLKTYLPQRWAMHMPVSPA